MGREEELAAFDRAFELAVCVSERMQEALAERGLTTSKAQVIFRLQQEGPLVQRRLSEDLRCTPRHVTALIDAMSEAGLVERAPHPTDRRATLVSLTEKGFAEAERMISERRDSAAELLRDVPTDRLTAFIAVAEHFIERLKPELTATDVGDSRARTGDSRA